MMTDQKKDKEGSITLCGVKKTIIIIIKRVEVRNR